MANKPMNIQHETFPNLFKRTGEAKRIKGFRASRTTFSAAMRLAKILESADSLVIYTPQGATILTVAATEILKQDGAIPALILNGFEITTYSAYTDYKREVEDFALSRVSTALTQQDLMNEEG